MSSVKRTIIAIFREYLLVTEENCVPEADIIRDLGVDSFNIWELIIAIEEKFNIRISDRELMETNTIQDFVDLIEKKKIRFMH